MYELFTQWDKNLCDAEFDYLVILTIIQKQLQEDFDPIKDSLISESIFALVPFSKNVQNH